MVLGAGIYSVWQEIYIVRFARSRLLLQATCFHSRDLITFETAPKKFEIKIQIPFLSTILHEFNYLLAIGDAGPGPGGYVFPDQECNQSFFSKGSTWPDRPPRIALKLRLALTIRESSSRRGLTNGPRHILAAAAFPRRTGEGSLRNITVRPF